MERYRFGQFVGADEHCHVATSMLPLPDGRAHTHDFFELFWVRRGSGWHETAGRRIALCPGTLVLIRPEDQHGFSATPDDHFWIVNIAFARSTWAAMRDRYPRLQPDPFDADVDERHHVLSGPLCAKLEEAAEELLGGQHDHLAIDRFLLNLLHVLGSAGASQMESNMPHWLAYTCREIAQPRHLRRGAAAFVELAGRSPEHVSRAARRFTGKTPTELLNDARLTYAAGRLAQTREAIADIAEECGLANLSHFYRLFGKRFGQTPRDYRQRQQMILGRGGRGEGR